MTSNWKFVLESSLAHHHSSWLLLILYLSNKHQWGLPTCAFLKHEAFLCFHEAHRGFPVSIKLMFFLVVNVTHQRMNKIKIGSQSFKDNQAFNWDLYGRQNNPPGFPESRFPSRDRSFLRNYSAFHKSRLKQQWLSSHLMMSIRISCISLTLRAPRLQPTQAALPVSWPPFGCLYWSQDNTKRQKRKCTRSSVITALGGDWTVGPLRR